MKIEKSKTKFATIISLLLLVLLLFSIHYLQTSSQIKTQREDISELMETVKSKNEEISSLNTNITALERDKDILEEEKDELYEEKTVLEDNLSELRANLESYRDTVSNLRKSLEMQKPSIKNYSLIAVDNSGNGKIYEVKIKLRSGSGDVSAALNNIEFEGDTQSSIRRAWNVAGEYTGVDTEDFDVTVTLVNDYSSLLKVEGGSGGAAITLGMIAALKGKEIDGDVLMTGTINLKGEIGSVTKLREKIRTARENGASMVLIPDSTYIAMSGIDVRQVSDIEEAAEIVLN